MSDLFNHPEENTLSSAKGPFEGLISRLSTVPRTRFSLAAKSMWEFNGTARQLTSKINSLGIIVEREPKEQKSRRPKIKVVIKDGFAHIEITDNRFRRLIETADGCFMTRPIIIRARIAALKID